MSGRLVEGNECAVELFIIYSIFVGDSVKPWLVNRHWQRTARPPFDTIMALLGIAIVLLVVPFYAQAQNSEATRSGKVAGCLNVMNRARTTRIKARTLQFAWALLDAVAVAFVIDVMLPRAYAPRTPRHGNIDTNGTAPLEECLTLRI